MTQSPPFVDYYSVLQIDPHSDRKVIRAAYRHLAKLYHPDHPASASIEKFNDVIEAYRALNNPERRAEYDVIYFEHMPHVAPSPSSAAYEGDEPPPLSDAESHARILRYLYKRRREHAQDAGVIAYYVQKELNCSDEHFEFHVWYLKSKGFIEKTEQGSLAITIEGVDHVISQAKTTRAEQLLIARSANEPG